MASIYWPMEKVPLQLNQYLLENEINSDFNFKIGGDAENIKAHKFILSMQSPVFDRMFNGGWLEAKIDPVISDVTAPAFKALLRYCYYECIDIEDDIAFSVIYAAKKYMLPLLEDASREKLIKIRRMSDAFWDVSSEQLIKLLSWSNVWDVFEYAIGVVDTELYDACIMYFKGDVTPVIEALQTEEFINIPHEVLLEFLNINDKNKTIDVSRNLANGENSGISISEVELFKACIAWAEAECLRQKVNPTGANKRTVLGECFFLIRFPTMLKEDLVRVVYPTGILTPEEMVNLRLYIYKPGAECYANFPSRRRQFLVSPPSAVYAEDAKIGIVHIKCTERVLLSRVWTKYPGTYRVTVKEGRYEETISTRCDTQHENHWTKSDPLRGPFMLYYMDIKAPVLQPGATHSLIIERLLEVEHRDPTMCTEDYIIVKSASFKEVKLSYKSNGDFIHALTLSLV